MKEQDKPMNENEKTRKLDDFRVKDGGEKLTTNQGLRISADEHSLKAGERGPTLMEDFHFREKMTHFDHERIPERIVHARGFGAHGYFQVYEPMAEYTRAGFLQDPSVKTPVFVRFSTVAGSRGSADTVRDVRGFATKFYTEEGNFDLVGNNIPVFFIQDAIKFPDLVHSFKPEPHNEMPQASTAHDTFWDFVGSNTETAHMIMWAMSDRAIPRSYRMMEGFGVHTFRFVNAEGKAHFVKFHWKPKLGVHSLVWDEAQKIAGKDPDFHRRDLYEAIENGHYPEFEFGVQLIKEEDEFIFDFDILDPTKIWPEEQVPVKIIGKMVLDRNPDNIFAETEQIAFHPGHVVPGIDFSNDPLLQGRLFSYTGTQLSRLGGPNFHEIPINRPVAPVHNNQRDGMHRMTINQGQVSYNKNHLQGGTPAPATAQEGGYIHYQEKVDGHKVRTRSESFKDHYSQAVLFWNSMSEVEKHHITMAFQFELGKVKDKEVRQRAVDMFSNVDINLANDIAMAIGAEPPAAGVSHEMKAVSPALSQENKVKLPDTRKVGILAADGFDAEELRGLLAEMEAANMIPEVVSTHLGRVKASNGEELEADHTFLTADSLLFDALYTAGGAEAAAKLSAVKDARDFLKEAFSHYKTIGGGTGTGEFFSAAGVLAENDPGIIVGTDYSSFIQAVSGHRHWTRELS